MTEPAQRSAKKDQPDVRDPRVKACIDRYWRSNVRIMGVLLLIWAIAGLGCGILFADFLNRFAIGGIPLGFWFAQQGSILVFVMLVLVYALLLNRLDAKHHRELQDLRRQGEVNGRTPPEPGSLPGSQPGGDPEAEA